MKTIRASWIAVLLLMVFGIFALCPSVGLAENATGESAQVADSAPVDQLAGIPSELVEAQSGKIEVSIRSADETWTYDGYEHDKPVYTVLCGGETVEPADESGLVFTLPQTGDTLTILEPAKVKNVSDTAEGNNTFSYELTNANQYNVQTTAGTLTIIALEQATVTIAGNSDTKTYSRSAQSVSGYEVSAKAGETVIPNTEFIVELAADKNAVAVGTDTGIYAMGLTKDDFMVLNPNCNSITVEYTDGVLTIQQMHVKVTITGHNDKSVYDGKEHSVSGYDVECSEDLYAQNLESNISFTGNAYAARTNVSAPSQREGTTYMGLSEDQFMNTNTNFKVQFEVVDGYQTIERRRLVVKTGGGEKVYDGTPLKNTEATITGLLEGETATVTATGEQTNYGKSYNTYEITWGTAKVGNYILANSRGVLNVTKAPLTITVKPQSYEYNGKPQGEDNQTYTDPAEISKKVEVQGLQGEDRLLSITLNGQQIEVGTYNSKDKNEGIVLSSVMIGTDPNASTTSNRNYEIHWARGTLTITAKEYVENRLWVAADGNTNIYVQPGKSTVLRVNVSANDLEGVTYQWYQYVQVDYGVYSAPVRLPGETGSSLTTGAIQKRIAYECTVTDKYGNNKTVWFNVGIENVFQVKADGNTNIYVQPGDSTVLRVNVSANDLEGVTYRWYDGNYSLLESETGSSLTTGAIQKYSQYHCTVTDKYGNSATVWFYVGIENGFQVKSAENVNIYVQPEESAVLRVNVTANDLEGVTYRWYDGNYSLLESEAGSSLTTGAIQKYSEYHCTVTDKYGNSNTIWFYVRVENGLRVNADGNANVYVQPGENAVLRVNVAANDLEGVTYQWYELVQYQDNNGVYSRSYTLPDEDGPSLMINSIQKYTKYECRVTDKYGNNATVRFYVGIENGLRVKADGNTNVYVQFGESTVLRVNVTGNDLEGVTYQWYEYVQDSDGSYTRPVILSGETGASLTTGAIQKYSEYYCAVTDKYGNNKSVWFSVRIENGFQVKADGNRNIYVQFGDNAVLRVNVTGNDLEGITYQWYEFVQDNDDSYSEPVILPDETESSLAIGPVLKRTAYECSVTDKYKNKKTVWFSVSVENGFQVEADGNRDIFVQSGESVTLQVNVTANDLEGVTYQWNKYIQDGYGIYSGQGILPDETGANLTTGPVLKNIAYDCRVTDKYGNSATVWFSVSVENGFQVKADGNTSVFVQLGDSATLRVKVIGNNLENVTYQWYKLVQHSDRYVLYRDQIISGEDKPSITIEAVNEFSEFICIVADNYGNEQEVLFNVGVENAFRAGTDTNSTVHVSSGSCATLSVQVAGNALDGVTYQWYELIPYEIPYEREEMIAEARAMASNRNIDETILGDYMAIEGETNDSFVTKPVVKDNYYTCIVSDKYNNPIRFKFHVRIQDGADTSSSTSFSLNLNEGSFKDYGLGATVENLWTVVELNDGQWGLNCHRTTISGEPDIKVPAVVPIRQGFTFVGWSDKPTAGVPLYLAGDSIETDADTTLYAVWVKPDLILPASLKIIEAEAFYGGAFTYVKLPETVQIIRNQAFADCPNLSYIYIPSTTEYIDRFAFNNVEDLTIIGESGSEAASFAEYYHYSFISIG